MRASVAPGRPLELPDLVPARMLNEFVYCPRLFFYEWVDGVFRHNADTVEGAQKHEKGDQKETTCRRRRKSKASGSRREA